MGRQPLDNEHETKTVTVRLTHADLAVLDMVRGDIPRSAWIRALVQNQTEQITGGTPIVEAPEDYKRPNHLAVVAASDRHHHHYVKNGDPVRYQQGTPIYPYRCDCGTEKEDR